ncbi:crossover junction endodeoxyribonuclease RuvC, partial [Francisella tularensis subsp. holarctica]|uniref:crossover junction endodeoxyribonuclease RuvC n=1 Tax=Francisella tularensis TaxID=263 RepID=UPI0023819AA0
GFGVIKVLDNKIYYFAIGCIQITEINTPKRHKQIADGIKQIINIYAPTEAAIEQIFMFQNPSGSIKLGQSRGEALCKLA